MTEALVKRNAGISALRPHVTLGPVTYDNHLQNVLLSKYFWRVEVPKREFEHNFIHFTNE